MSGLLIGTGEYRQHAFMRKLWDDNTDTRRQGMPRYDVVRIAVGCDFADHIDAYGTNILLGGNCGHVGDLLSGGKPHALCGWSSAVLALAMIAYCDESDFLYKEQDCLAFGPWIDQMYKDLGNKGMVFGRKMVGPPYMECSQSLFLIRHRFIPEFVRRYIELGPDGDPNNLPETKFAKMEAANPQHYARLSFGYDRERPINFDDKVWFAQKFTAQEIQELKKRGLI